VVLVHTFPGYFVGFRVSVIYPVKWGACHDLIGKIVLILVFKLQACALAYLSKNRSLGFVAVSWLFFILTGVLYNG